MLTFLLDPRNFEVSVGLFESSLITAAPPPSELFSFSLLLPLNLLHSSILVLIMPIYIFFYFYISLILPLHCKISEECMVWPRNVRIRKSWFCLQLLSDDYNIWPALSLIFTFLIWSTGPITAPYFLYTSKGCDAQRSVLCKPKVFGRYRPDFHLPTHCPSV